MLHDQNPARPNKIMGAGGFFSHAGGSRVGSNFLGKRAGSFRLPEELGRIGIT